MFETTMKRILLAAALLAAACVTLGAQPKKKAKDTKAEGKEAPAYTFTTVKALPVTSIKNQYRSGTCWCFSTLSFLESEIIRIKGISDSTKYPDLSEMYVVSKSYQERADKYVRLDGNLKFGAGSEADDVLDVIRDHGIVPQAVMQGLNYGTDKPVHNEMDALLKGYVETVAKKPNRGVVTPVWKQGFNAILNAYLGACPDSFEYEGKKYTPASYRDELGIVPADYVTLTSFTHHPFYTAFALEVEDNWRWDTMYNLPLDEFIQVLDNALENGYTAAWGTDVSQKGFTRKGLAILRPDEEKASDSDQSRWVGKDGKKESAKAAEDREEEVTQESRQRGFDSKKTTDDHGMHIFGIAKDQNGRKYYLVKNSWGKTGDYQGIWYATEAFVRAQSMSLMVHKDALPAAIRSKLSL